MSAAKVSVSTRKVSIFLKPYWSPSLGNSVRPDVHGLLMQNLEMENRMTATRTSNTISAGIYGQPVVIISRQNWTSSISAKPTKQPFGKCLTRRKAKHAIRAANLTALMRTLLMVCYRAGKHTLETCMQFRKTQVLKTMFVIKLNEL